MRFKKFFSYMALGVIIAFSVPIQSVRAQSSTVDAIMKRGQLNCGTGQGNYHGFAVPDKQGIWRGFDVEFCRAVAVAILGDKDKVKFVALSSVQRFPALQSGDVDLLIRTTTWTLTRDTDLGFQFGQPNFFTGLGMMVHKKLGVKEGGKELDGAAVCVFPGTTSEKAIADYFRAHKISYKPVVIENAKERDEAYLSERCDLMAAFVPGLAIVRAYSAKNPDDHVILPFFLEKEPLAPVVRQGDDDFLDIVNWVLFATLEAEELGVTTENVDDLRKNTKNPKIMRLLGTTPGVGKKLGLREEWVYNVIKQIGNYAEIFERNLGKNSKLKLDRNYNHLWSNGGVLYVMPFS